MKKMIEKIEKLIEELYYFIDNIYKHNKKKN